MPQHAQIISGRQKDIGGFTVARVLPWSKRRRVGPFVFFDEMGPAVFEPGTGIDVRPHPHIGLATVTYLFEGEMDHADSLGVHQTIRPGDVNWMTAGCGVTHSERTGPKARRDGHSLHGIQVWVGLPEDREAIEPAFHHHKAGALPRINQDGAQMRLILGTAYGETSPVATYSPIVYLHAEAPAGARFELPKGYDDIAIYVVSGAIEAAGEAVSPGQMAVFSRAHQPVIRARQASRLMILGGNDIGERHIEWNFVASDRARIEQAKNDWRASIKSGFTNAVFSLPPGESEWIDLPGDPVSGPPESTPDCPTS
jgi:redox-sensitive bicupin YhaK (pirin superfamily)